jgi:hypothetical protein
MTLIDLLKEVKMVEGEETDLLIRAISVGETGGKIRD